jgi:hypothetical protein
MRLSRGPTVSNVAPGSPNGCRPPLSRKASSTWSATAPTRPTIHYRVRPGRNQLAARCELGPGQLSKEFRDLKFGKFKLGLSLLQSPHGPAYSKNSNCSGRRRRHG